MILDVLTNAERVAQLHPLFATAFAWLAANREIADGRHAIRGEDLFAIVETGTTFAAEQRRFESHRTYIDIQVNLGGGEIMEWLPVRDLIVEDDFHPEGDIAFYRTPAVIPTRLHVRPNEFAIFYPSDAHKPVCHPPSGPTTYRKVVFKVRQSAQFSAGG